jgi:carbonic anhydrase
MSDLATLLERNRRFAADFREGDLAIRPRLSTVVLTCLDARVDPAHFLGLELGDVVVLRNAGGRITPAVLSDLAVLGFLAGRLPGNAATQLELAVIHHPDCGMSRLADPAAQQDLAERLGVEPADIASMAITDPAESVRADIETLRRMPGAPGSLVVSGHTYDVATGALSTIVEPAPLGLGNAD